MNKKLKKSLVTIMSIVMSTGIIVSATTVMADSVTKVPVNRIDGATRYETAAELATTNWETSKDVILVSGQGAYDAISATALAKKLNAPILLTTAGILDSHTAKALATLNAENIYIVGGNASVSQSVRSDLKYKYNLVEISGANRYETNLNVAKKLVQLGVSATNVMMAGGEGWSDALSVASVAAAREEIVLLGNNDSAKMAATVNFIKQHNSRTTVVGTKYVINDTILKSVNGTRINGGADRFATNLNVLNAFKAYLTEDTTYVANATDKKMGFADALVAAAAAAKTVSPLVLVDKQGSAATQKAINYIKENTPKNAINVLGGTGVITDDTFDAINEVVNPEDTEFKVDSIS